MIAPARRLATAGGLRLRPPQPRPRGWHPPGEGGEATRGPCWYWLSAEQGKKLIASPSGPELRAVRNRAVLAMLIGCGLRRAEVVTVAVEDFELREDHWLLADLIVRVVTCAQCRYQDGSRPLSMSGLAQPAC